MSRGCVVLSRGLSPPAVDDYVSTTQGPQPSCCVPRGGSEGVAPPAPPLQLLRLDTICWLPLDKRSAPLLSRNTDCVCRNRNTSVAPQTTPRPTMIYSPPSPSPSLPSFLISCFPLILFTLFCSLMFPLLYPASPHLSVLPLSSAFAFPSSLNIGLVFSTRPPPHPHATHQVKLFRCERLLLRATPPRLPFPLGPAGSVHL